MVNTPDYAISTAVLLGVQSQLLPVQKNLGGCGGSFFAVLNIYSLKVDGNEKREGSG